MTAGRIASRVKLGVVLAIGCAVLLTGCNKDRSHTESVGEATEAQTKSTDSRKQTKVTAIGSRQKPAVATLVPQSNSRATTASVAKEMATASGRVTLQDGSPAAGTTVTMSSLNWTGSLPDIDSFPEVASTATDADGIYHLKVPLLGAFLLEVHKSGYGVESHSEGMESWPLRTRTESAKKDFVLKPAIIVDGMVTDAVGAPVAGATVRARPFTGKVERFTMNFSKNFVTTSGADGRFHIDHFAASQLAVAAEATGHGFVTETVNAPRSDAKLVLPSGGATYMGTVRTKETNAPTKGINVRFTKRIESNVAYQFLMPRISSETNSEGKYLVEHLPPGDYFLTAEAAGVRLLPTKPTDHGPGQAMKVGANDPPKELDLFVYSGHSISGRAMDRKRGSPLAGVKISSFTGFGSTSSSVVSADDGTFKLANLFPIFGNSLSLKIERDGYTFYDASSGEANICVLNSDDRNLAIARDLELLPNITVSGIVKTEEGMPVTNGSVSIMESNRVETEPRPKSILDSTGRFELPAKPPSVQLLAEAPDYPSVKMLVQVSAEPITDTKIIMKAGAKLRGTVVSAEGGNIPRAKVSVLQNRANAMETLMSVLTDENGMFALQKVPTDNVQLMAEAKGYIGANLPMKLTPGETSTGLKLVLEKAHFLAGRVLDENQQPVQANVTVNLKRTATSAFPGVDDQGITTSTDELGRYRFDTLRSEPIQKLIAFAPGYKVEEKTDVAVDQENVDFVVKKRQAAVFTGTVLEQGTNKPIVDFRVNGSEIGSVPEHPEQFTIKEIAEGEPRQISISAPGHIVQAQTITIPAGKLQAEQTFHLVVASKITGRAIDKSTRAPIANVRVSLESQGRNNYSSGEQSDSRPTANTDAEGRFQLDGGAAGNNTVAFDPPPPYAKLFIDVAVEAATPAEMGDVALDSGGSIMGRVVKMPGDAPVPGARLSLQSSRTGITKSATSGTDGKFEFTGLPNDIYVVASNDRATMRVILEASERKEITLRIGGVTLKGSVVRAGQPATAQVNLEQGTYAQSVSRDAQTDDNGQFTINNLSPGKWKAVIYSRDQGGSINDTVDLPESGVIEKTFTLPSGKIIGVVVDSQGTPVAKAQVRAKALEGSNNEAWNQVLPGSYSSSSAETKDDGTFELRSAKPGKYSLSADKKGVGKAQAVEAEAPLEGESAKAVLTLQPIQTGTLVSVALNMSTGGPIKEAWCILWSGNDKISNSSQRDDKGVMKIEDIPAGEYRVQVSSFGFAVSERNVTIEAGKTTNIEDVLYDAGAVRFSVQDKNGSPIGGADCTLTPDDPKSIEQPRRGKTDASGLWVVRGLYPGSYSATAMASGKTPAKGSTTVVAHQPIDLVIKLE